MPASHASGASPGVHAGVYAQCAAADFVICASEKQRDLWLGGITCRPHRPRLLPARPHLPDDCGRGPLRLERTPANACQGQLGGVWRASSMTVCFCGVEASGVGSTRSPRSRRSSGWSPRTGGSTCSSSVSSAPGRPAAGPDERRTGDRLCPPTGLEGRCVHFNYGWSPTRSARAIFARRISISGAPRSSRDPLLVSRVCSTTSGPGSMVPPAAIDG